MASSSTTNNNTMMIRYESQNRVVIKSPPKAPLTAYNLYFQLERKRILEGTDSFGFPITHQEIKRAAAEFKARTGKRIHRKTHGKIGFKELARVVANRWKELDSETKDMLADHARIEKEEHTAQVREWEKSDEYKREQAQQRQAETSYQHRTMPGANNNPRDMSGAPFSKPSCSVDSHPGMSDLELFRAMWNEHNHVSSNKTNTQECFMIPLPQVFPPQQQQSSSPLASLLSFTDGTAPLLFPSLFGGDDAHHAPAAAIPHDAHQWSRGDYQQQLHQHHAGQQNFGLDEYYADLFEPVPLLEPGSAAPQPSSYMGM